MRTNIVVFAFLLVLAGGRTPAAAQISSAVTDSVPTPCFRLTEDAEHFFGEVKQNETVVLSRKG